MKSKSVFASAVNCCDLDVLVSFYITCLRVLSANHCDLFADLGRAVMSWQLDV